MKKLDYWIKTLDDIRDRRDEAYTYYIMTNKESWLRDAHNWEDLEEYALEVAREEGVYLI